MHETLTQAAKWFDRLNIALATIAGSFLVLITVAICWEILSRWILGVGNLWLVEISEYMLLYVTFLGAAWVLGNDRHVAIDLVLNQLSAANQRRLQVFLSSLGAICCLVIAWFGVVMTIDQFQAGIRETTLLAPESFWITSVIPFGFLLLGVQFLRRVVRSALGLGLASGQH